MPFQTKKVISVAILLALVAFAVYYLRNNLSDFKQLQIANPLLLISLVFIFFFNTFLTGILNNSLMSAVGLRLRQGETFALSIVTGFYNFITPFRGGMAVRAIYLKQKHKFAYVHFLATLSAVYVLIFLVAGILGAFSTILIYLQTGIFSWVLFIIFMTVFISMLLIILVSPEFKERENKWLNKFIKIINGWHLIKNNKRVIVITTIITFMQILLSSLMLSLQFLTFGIHIPFASALFLSAIGNLSLLIGITPGNLGINEAIIVFSAATIGIIPVQSLSAVLLGRAVSLVVLFILGPIFSYILLKHNPKKPLENERINETNNTG